MRREPALPLEIRIDRGACRGSQNCVRRAPGTFSLDAHRRSEHAHLLDIYHPIQSDGPPDIRPR